MRSVLAKAGFAMAIHRLGIDGIDWKPRLQQGGDKESVGRFDDAGKLLHPVWCPNDTRA
jgi:hypothetical protein